MHLYKDIILQDYVHLIVYLAIQNFHKQKNLQIMSKFNPHLNFCLYSIRKHLLSVFYQLVFSITFVGAITL